MSTYISESLKARIQQADRQRCCYCLTSAANSGIPMTFDHIQPRSKNGATSFENVCLACRTCNEYKSDTTEANDPLTGKAVPLFNPRIQKWSEHFSWSLDARKVEGLTAIGRATSIDCDRSSSECDRVGWGDRYTWMDAVCKKHEAKLLEEAKQEIKQFQKEYSD